MADTTDFGANGVDESTLEETNDLGTSAAPVLSHEEAQAKRLKEMADAHEKVKAAGWTDPVPFNYTQVTGGEASAGDLTKDYDGAPWLSEAAIYEWDDEYGDIGPVNEVLERQLFHDHNLMRIGNQISALSFEVKIEGPDRIAPVREFTQAGLHPIMLNNVGLCNYMAPTPIQCYCIPAVLTGHDVVACAQTGSGKTAAYLIPIISKLMGKAKLLAAPRPRGERVRAEPLVLIVCPTRELACQIFDEARRLCYRSMLRPCVIYGGAPSRQQREQLEKGCDILIATPGRLGDFMSNINLLSFSRLKFTVIDEADELLSAGWEDTIEKLFQGSDTNEDADHTYLMFSATFPKAARKLAREYMDQDYVKIKVGRVGSTHENIKQDVIYVDDSAKNRALFDLIMDGGPLRTIVFVNTKNKCDMVDDFLYNNGLPTTSIHSDRTQREREDALRAFKLAKCPILVATGVTARGIDVANVKHIINYDLPSTQHGGITEYIHRIGRTARIGNIGRATSFYNDRNEDLAEDLCRILIESKNNVPDFLQHKIPEQVEFTHQGTDDEDSDGGAFGDGFGGQDESNDFGSGFGGGQATTNDTGTGGDFQADNGNFQPEGDDKVNTW